MRGLLVLVMFLPVGLRRPGALPDHMEFEAKPHPGNLSHSASVYDEVASISGGTLWPTILPRFISRWHG
jgi:hypothetical protein